MTSPDSCQSIYQFESVSLGSNEEFVRLYNKFADSVWDSAILADVTFLRMFKTAHERCFEFISKTLRGLDRLLNRAEKNAQLHEVLAGIVHLIRQKFCPALREVISWRDRWSLLFPLESSELTDHLREQETRLGALFAVFTNSVASRLDSAYNVVVSAVVMLALVYQYLLGCVDMGGSKTYSSGSLDFRDCFRVHGASVWIKFRQASCSASRRKRRSLETPHQASPFGSHESPVRERGVYRRAVRDKFGTFTRVKYEPRFKPPRERLDSGTTLTFNYLTLGSYDTDHEARIVRQIAAFFYGKEDGDVQIEDGLCFSIPSMSEQEKSLSGKEKAEWVTSKTKAVYAGLLEEMKRQRVQLLNPVLRTNSDDGGATTDPGIQFAEIEACAALSTYGTELASLPAAAPSLAPDQYNWSAGFAGSEFTIDELLANDPAPQSSGLENQMHTGGVTDIVAHPGGCLPQAVAGAAAEDLEHGEPELMSPPMESPHGQVNHLQQLLARYKKELQDSALLNVELMLELMESEVQNSELQRENENLRSMRQRVAKFQVATCSSFITDVDIQ